MITHRERAPSLSLHYFILYYLYIIPSYIISIINIILFTRSLRQKAVHKKIIFKIFACTRIVSIWTTTTTNYCFSSIITYRAAERDREIRAASLLYRRQSEITELRLNVIPPREANEETFPDRLGRKLRGTATARRSVNVRIPVSTLMFLSRARAVGPANLLPRRRGSKLNGGPQRPSFEHRALEMRSTKDAAGANGGRRHVHRVWRLHRPSFSSYPSNLSLASARLWNSPGSGEPHLRRLVSDNCRHLNGFWSEKPVLSGVLCHNTG